MTSSTWHIAPADYPATASLRAQWQFFLRYAILAPSTHNTQPWRFELHDEGVDVWVDESRTLPIIDPAGRQRLMSCAAALYNLRVAARAFGHKVREVQLPEPSASPALLARLRTIGQRRVTASDLALRDAIPTRRTNRQPFAMRPVSHAIASDLAEVARSQGAWLLRLHPRAKAPLADIITAADRTQFADAAFRKELARWLVSSGSPRRDGIPFAKKEYGNRLPLGPTLLVRTFDIGNNVAAKETALATGSPMLVVLGTPGDAPADWLAAGLAMQAVWLKACTYGLSASYLNQALELAELREQVVELVEHRFLPQLIMRFGFGPEVATPTPRRPLCAVLTSQVPPDHLTR